MRDFEKAGLNKFRITQGPCATDDSIGNSGGFVIPLNDNTIAMVIANSAFRDEENDFPWEHASVHIQYRPKGKKNRTKRRTPTWSEMAKIKHMFWEDDEVVMQLHVEIKNHVNIHPNVLHLWRHRDIHPPLPPKEAV